MAAASAGGSSSFPIAPRRDPLLDGLVVVQAARSRSVRFATHLLAELGASVLRVIEAAGAIDEEPAPYLDAYIDGIPTRGRIRDVPRLADVLDQAAANTTMVVIADRPGPGEGGLATATASWVTLSAFGSSGPWAGRRGGELMVQALGGYCVLIGYPERPPLYIPHGFAALQLGLHGAAAAVAAATQWLRQKQAVHVDIAGADVLAAYSRMYSMLYRQYGIPPRRSGLRAPGSGGRYPFGIFPCRDGYVVLIARYPADWDRYLEMMGRPAWVRALTGIDDFTLATRFADELDRHVIPWLRERTREELAALGRMYNLPIAPVRRLDEVLADEQLAWRAFFQSGPDGTVIPGLPAWVYSPAPSSQRAESAGT